MVNCCSLLLNVNIGQLSHRMFDYKERVVSVARSYKFLFCIVMHHTPSGEKTNIESQFHRLPGETNLMQSKSNFKGQDRESICKPSISSK